MKNFTIHFGCGLLAIWAGAVGQAAPNPAGQARIELVSPDNKTRVVAFGNKSSRPPAIEVAILNTATRKKVKTIWRAPAQWSSTDSIMSLDWAPDGKLWLESGGPSGHLFRLIDVPTQKVVFTATTNYAEGNSSTGVPEYESVTARESLAAARRNEVGEIRSETGYVGLFGDRSGYGVLKWRSSMVDEVGVKGITDADKAKYPKETAELMANGNAEARWRNRTTQTELQFTPLKGKPVYVELDGWLDKTLLSPNKKILATITQEGELRTWNLKKGTDGQLTINALGKGLLDPTAKVQPSAHLRGYDDIQIPEWTHFLNDVTPSSDVAVWGFSPDKSKILVVTVEKEPPLNAIANYYSVDTGERFRVSTIDELSSSLLESLSQYEMENWRLSWLQERGPVIYFEHEIHFSKGDQTDEYQISVPE